MDAKLFDNKPSPNLSQSNNTFKAKDTPNVRIIRIGYNNQTTNSTLYSPHKRSLSQYRSDLLTVSKNDSITTEKHIPDKTLLEKIDFLNSRIQSLEQEVKIILGVNRNQEKQLGYKTSEIQSLNQQLSRFCKTIQKGELLTKIGFLQSEIKVSLHNHNTKFCVDCEDLQKKAKAAQSTIKFYQDEVNKWNKANAQLKVQKIDLINQISEMRRKLQSFQEQFSHESRLQVETLRKKESDMLQEIRRLKEDELQRSCRDKFRKSSIQSFSDNEQIKQKLEKDLQNQRIKTQQMSFRILRLREQFDEKEMQNNRLQKQISTQKKARKLLQESLKQIQNSNSSSQGELYNQMRDMDKRLDLKYQEVSMLNAQLKQLENKNNHNKIKFEAEVAELKSTIFSKESELKSLNQKINSLDKQNQKLRLELKMTKIELDQANKLFGKQLTSVEKKISQYNQYFEEMENQLQQLQNQNRGLKQKVKKHQVIEEVSRQLKFDDEDYRDVGVVNRYKGIQQQNKQLKQRVRQLTKQNTKILKNNNQLNNCYSQHGKVVGDMRKQAYILFKKLQEFQNRIYKQMNSKESRSQNPSQQSKQVQ